jgi:hypothetical protein
MPVGSEQSIDRHPFGSAARQRLLRFHSRRHSFATADLSEAAVQAIAASRMNERHADLNALLDEG